MSIFHRDAITALDVRKGFVLREFTAGDFDTNHRASILKFMTKQILLYMFGAAAKSSQAYCILPATGPNVLAA